MFRRIICMIMLLAVVLVPTQAAALDVAEGTPLLFRETGHTLAYNFRAFWDKYGGLPIFGFPVTEVFIEEGRPVQYFERARFEWHGDRGRVLAGHLGRWAAQGRADHPAFAPVPATTDQDVGYFVETQHTIRAAFRKYWLTKGGLPAFGFPLSEEFVELNPQDGQSYTVQYFERARFEYHPELPLVHQVQLGHLGVQYLAAEKPAPETALAAVTQAEQAWDHIRPTNIRIPRIGLDSEIVEGGLSLKGWDVPRYTAVHYWPVAGYPGTAGNITLAGHIGYRDIIFSQLPDAQVDDEIIVNIGERERKYRISDILTVLPEDSWVMAPTPKETLTLITCVPIGVYTHRLIVRALPVE